MDKIKTTLKDIFSDIRVFLYGGIATLPLTLGGTMLILGLFTANYAMLFFLLGYLVAVPFLAWAINKFIGGLLPQSLIGANRTDICNLVIPYTTLTIPTGTVKENVLSSEYVAMISFFVGYIFTNALELFNRDSPDMEIDVNTNTNSDIHPKITNRKSQAVIAMITVIVFGLIVLGLRLYSGCESTFGWIITTLAFILAGSGLYQGLSAVGQDRLSDLFGIANRLLPPSAINNGPIACIPMGGSS
jgi:hypothetical protein